MVESNTKGESSAQGGLRASSLSVAYRKRMIFKDVSLHLPPGSGAVLMGSSGVGKTTFVRTLAGLQPTTEGTVRINGHDIVGPSHDVCVVFQRGNCFPWLTALENMMFSLRCQGAHRDSVEIDRVKSILVRVGLGHCFRLLPREMSGGMVQRLALARAIAAHPKTLILDEPFSALDPVTSAEQLETGEI